MAENYPRRFLIFSIALLLAVSLSAALVILFTATRGMADDEIPAELERQLARTEEGDHEVLAVYADDEHFDPLPPPRRGDWRLGPGSDEEPQSFRQYVASNPVRATKERTRIVLAPLGAFDEEERRVLETMREYGEIFFAGPVEIGEDLALPERGRRRRTDGAAPWDQYHTREILYRVLQPRLPEDAIAYLGITMEDLYPQSSWNYVFGQADLVRRIGVYSLARYGPGFWGEEDFDAARVRLVLRACKVFAHETCHMFGMEHCLHYLCSMNGSNSLAETDRQPVWLCPVCASKLTWNRGFDPAERYEKLSGFFEKVSMPDVAKWYAERAAAIRKAD